MMHPSNSKPLDQINLHYINSGLQSLESLSVSDIMNINNYNKMISRNKKRKIKIHRFYVENPFKKRLRVEEDQFINVEIE